MPKSGRIMLSGTSKSQTCLFTIDENGGYLRSDPGFLSSAVGSTNLKLKDSTSGWSASIRIEKSDKRGNAAFRWL